jgi:hypothetical protein
MEGWQEIQSRMVGNRMSIGGQPANLCFAVAFYSPGGLSPPRKLDRLGSQGVAAGQDYELWPAGGIHIILFQPWERCRG